MTLFIALMMLAAPDEPVTWTASPDPDPHFVEPKSPPQRAQAPKQRGIPLATPGAREAQQLHREVAALADALDQAAKAVDRANRAAAEAAAELREREKASDPR